MTWHPRTGEDRLLETYWRRHDWPLLFREVTVGGAMRWRGSRARRIDGVLVHPSSDRAAHDGKAFRRALKAGAAWKRAELVEVKQGLSEAVIGQALAGRWLFEHEVGREHGVGVARNVVLYRHEDPAMRWVVDQLDGVEAERVEVPAANACMKSRQHYEFVGEEVRRMVVDRAQAPGMVVTRVPIGGDDSGVAAWAGSAETHVRFLRVVGHPTQVVAAFEGRDWLLEHAGGRELEVVVVRRRLMRGPIGVALAHALMIEKQYGVPRPRAAVVCERGDAALEAACEGLGVAVRVVGA